MFHLIATYSIGVESGRRSCAVAGTPTLPATAAGRRRSFAVAVAERNAWVCFEAPKKKRERDQTCQQAAAIDSDNAFLQVVAECADGWGRVGGLNCGKEKKRLPDQMIQALEKKKSNILHNNVCLQRVSDLPQNCLTSLTSVVHSALYSECVL